MKNFNKIILSLGSNIGDKKSNLETAINQINMTSSEMKDHCLHSGVDLVRLHLDN